MAISFKGAHCPLNEAAIQSDHKAHGTAIAIRKVSELNHPVEPDHRAVKRVTRPLMGCQACAAAQWT